MNVTKILHYGLISFIVALLIFLFIAPTSHAATYNVGEIPLPTGSQYGSNVSSKQKVSCDTNEGEITQIQFGAFSTAQSWSDTPRPSYIDVSFITSSTSKHTYRKTYGADKLSGNPTEFISLDINPAVQPQCNSGYYEVEFIGDGSNARGYIVVGKSANATGTYTGTCTNCNDGSVHIPMKITSQPIQTGGGTTTYSTTTINFPDEVTDALVLVSLALVGIYFIFIVSLITFYIIWTIRV